ncbi:MAG: hydantoinase/oxoprolinase family protein [Xanthomonadaceae bacterium]|nr:hydantoinase/oxoprolinase family protein [Xanthomonadaceae bacterium]
MRIGVDTGGTFTDFVAIGDDGRVRTHKVPSTPDAPERAILQGLSDLGIEAAAVVHGSTVATNAVLEGKGARTVFVTSHGFGDTLTIGRQARARLYDLQPPAVVPPVPAELCVETGGRVTPQRTTLEPLGDEALAALRARVAALDPEAVAVSLLFSFVDDTHERRIEAALADLAFVSRSSTVLPEVREYERGIATWLNARLGPLMGGYLGRLEAALPGTRLAVMQSSGGTIAAAHAARHTVRLLLSGPAGGVMGAALLGRLAGYERLLAFDMGGTSTDVTLVDGAPRLTSEGRVAGYPVAVPMVDLHTIGAGGGSIAWRDAGGALQVGPQSAGAMAQALRVISVERGEDPRDFVLFPFGGAGGLHVCALAEKLGIRRALFPANAGVLSALGMLAAPRARNLSRTLPGALADVDRTMVAQAFDALSAQGRDDLAAEGVAPKAVTVVHSADLRYCGQSYTLEVPWSDEAAAAFEALHETRYGHALPLPVELVNLRVRVEAPAEQPRLPTVGGAGEKRRGPQAVVTADATLWIAEGWEAERDALGNWMLQRP